MEGPKIRNLLLKKLDRLVRLLELDAPEALIYNDLFFVFSMRSLFPKKMQVEIDLVEREHKNEMGLCCNKNCVGKVDPSQEERIGTVQCISCLDKKLLKIRKI